MNVIDSSAWLEYFAGGRNAEFFAPAIEDSARLIVPAIVVYEVFKSLLRQRGEDIALQAVALLHQGRFVDLDASLAMSAARLSLDLKLPMVDSIVLAVARCHGAVVWTQDADFQALPDARFKPKG